MALLGFGADPTAPGNTHKGGLPLTEAVRGYSMLPHLDDYVVEAILAQAAAKKAVAKCWWLRCPSSTTDVRLRDLLPKAS